MPASTTGPRIAAHRPIGFTVARVVLKLGRTLMTFGLKLGFKLLAAVARLAMKGLVRMVKHITTKLLGKVFGCATNASSPLPSAHGLERTLAR